MGLFDAFRAKPKSLLDALQSSPEFQKQKQLFDEMSALCEGGIDADEMPNSNGEFGLVSTNPIPCKTVFGSTAYLGRLRAADGSKVLYERLGSTMSAVSSHPIDQYEVTHSSGRKLATLYVSPYQKRISGKAPVGFMLADNSFVEVAPVRTTVTEPDGTEKFQSCGILHRDDGPAVVEVYADYEGHERHRSWYQFGLLDRGDGPAVIGGRTTNGQYEWWRAGVRHRDEGPAVIEMLESYEFGPGPVYEWWRNGIRQKVQGGEGIIYHFKTDETLVLAELPDGHRIIESDGEYWVKDINGYLVDGPLRSEGPLLESYQGYLAHNQCSHALYQEPRATFEIHNPDAQDE